MGNTQPFSYLGLLRLIVRDQQIFNRLGAFGPQGDTSVVHILGFSSKKFLGATPYNRIDNQLDIRQQTTTNVYKRV